MSKNILEALLGSKTRLKILKFIFRNENMVFTPEYVAEHTQEPLVAVQAELDILAEINLIKIKK